MEEVGAEDLLRKLGSEGRREGNEKCREKMGKRE